MPSGSARPVRGPELAVSALAVPHLAGQHRADLSFGTGLAGLARFRIVPSGEKRSRTFLSLGSLLGGLKDREGLGANMTPKALEGPAGQRPTANC